jgi:hypothetical protein
MFRIVNFWGGSCYEFKTIYTPGISHIYRAAFISLRPNEVLAQPDNIPFRMLSKFLFISGHIIILS